MKLTLTNLKKLNDDDLFDIIHTYADSKISRTSGCAEEIAVMNRIPKGFSAIYSTWLADIEICNGGYYQFFYNHTAGYGDVAISGYTLMELNEFSDLMERALKIHIEICGENDIENIKKMREKYDDRQNRMKFDELENRYFSIKGTYDSRKVEFIKENLEMFSIDE